MVPAEKGTKTNRNSNNAKEKGAKGQWGEWMNATNVGKKRQGSGGYDGCWECGGRGNPRRECRAVKKRMATKGEVGVDAPKGMGKTGWTCWKGTWKDGKGHGGGGEGT